MQKSLSTVSLPPSLGVVPKAADLRSSDLAHLQVREKTGWLLLGKEIQKHEQGTGHKRAERVSQLNVVVFTDQHGGRSTDRHPCWLVSSNLLFS